MSFLSPLMLLGLLGAVIPVAIHLQGRRKATHIPFAALEFLLATDKRLAKRLVVRQVFLLAFRMLICAVAALLLARPYASCQSSGPRVSAGPQAAVLIVDNSVASRYRLHDRSLLSLSLENAKDVLRQLGPEAEVAIITTTGGDQDTLSRDQLGLEKALDNATASFLKADGEHAFRRALALLVSSPHPHKTIFLLAAPTRSVLPVSLSLAAQGISVQVVSPAQGEELPNLAITDIQGESDTSMGSRGLRVIAQVANFSSEDKLAKLSLTVGDQVVARGELKLAAGQSASKAFTTNLSGQAISTTIRVHVKDEGLAADNNRYLVASAHDQVAVLLVNGDARALRHQDELFYFEAALRPGDHSDSGAVITRASPADLPKQSLGNYDVIVLANVEPLSPKEVARLSEWVDAGGGLFVTMGDHVDADAYNRSMAPLLAQKLRSTLDLRHGLSRGARPDIRLGKLELEHPLFSVFSKDAPGLYNASFWHIMLLGATTNSADTAHNKPRVLASFDNGAAALVEASSGNGLLMLFASTLDRDWNNLAIHPGYLPLFQQAIRYLASKPSQRQEQQIVVGDSVSLKVSGGDVRLEIAGPGRLRIVLEGEQVAGLSATHLESIDVPGVYRVSATDKSGVIQPRPQSTFAANLDASALDLSLLPTNELERRNGDSSSVTAPPSRRVELWHGIALLLLLLLLLEAGVSFAGNWRELRQVSRPR